MSRTIWIAIGATLLSAVSAAAQVELKTYANAAGYIDVQALTCAQLANTFQEDADYLMVWYSGWYNWLAKKHLARRPNQGARARDHRSLQGKSRQEGHPGDRRRLQRIPGA